MGPSPTHEGGAGVIPLELMRSAPRPVRWTAGAHAAPCVGSEVVVLCDPENPRRNGLHPCVLVKPESIAG